MFSCDITAEDVISDHHMKTDLTVALVLAVSLMGGCDSKRSRWQNQDLARQEGGLAFHELFQIELPAGTGRASETADGARYTYSDNNGTPLEVEVWPLSQHTQLEDLLDKLQRSVVPGHSKNLIETRTSGGSNDSLSDHWGFVYLEHETIGAELTAFAEQAVPGGALMCHATAYLRDGDDAKALAHSLLSLCYSLAAKPPPPAHGVFGYTGTVKLTQVAKEPPPVSSLARRSLLLRRRGKDEALHDRAGRVRLRRLHGFVGQRPRL